MSDSTETPGLAEAWEILAVFEPADVKQVRETPPRLRSSGERLVLALTDALAEVDRLTADLSALRIEHDAVRGLLTHTRRERDEARDETSRMWDATKADRARMGELESRPGYDAAVRACARIVEGSVVPENAHRSILALLEPKP